MSNIRPFPRPRRREPRLRPEPALIIILPVVRIERPMPQRTKPVRRAGKT